MSEARIQPAAPPLQAAPVPGFLVELDSWPRLFSAIFPTLIFRRRAPLQLESAPAPFWTDVFVRRRLPWLRFVESIAYHILALEALLFFSRFSSLQPLPQPRPMFNHAQVITYEPVEYLPPLDTRRAEATPSRKADPELSSQPIISLPPEADNRFQTIVAPPVVKLKHDVALPNIVAWHNQSSPGPQLAIAPPPLVMASSITRIAPEVSNSVVAPPPDLWASLQSAIPKSPQPAVIAPPPRVENSPVRSLGDLNIGRAAVIAPAPRLPVGEQRTISRAATPMSDVTSQVVPPPPKLAPSGYSAAGARVIALNLHPTVGAPPDPPSGNRRGAFAATPEGHRGASGNPGISGNNLAATTSHGSAPASKANSELPAGLYVGNAINAKTSSVAGDPAGKNSLTANSVSPRLVAKLSAPGANVPARSVQPESAKLSEPERAVFGDRKFYSLTLNMPNLNSAGGSWVVRFAEIKQDSTEDSSGLSAPTATRKVDPAYPLQLMRENVAGTVIVYAIIHADGSVGAVRVLRGVDDRIDPFASQAISQWKFQPATKNGEPVDVEATFQIPFRPGRVRSNF